MLALRCAALLILAFGIYMLYRNQWTYKWHIYYSDRLHEYLLTQLNNPNVSNLLKMYETDIEPYNETMKRFWDWNPKNIISYRFQMLLKGL